MLQRYTRTPLMLLILSLVISCGTTETLPVTRLPEGNVKRMMLMPEFTKVKAADNEVKRWAREALLTINDLEYTIRLKDE